jgi:hypothetical protein
MIVEKNNMRVLIVLILSASAAYAGCTPELVCDWRNNCQTIQVCR